MPLLLEPEDIQSYPFSPLERPQKVLMVDPEHFDVTYQINPHMGSDGEELPIIDEKRARYQWEKLKEKLKELGLNVTSFPGQEGLPDMVFAANQVLPLDSKRILLSRMAHEERAGEVQHFKDYFEHHGIQVIELPEEVEKFEGTGDGLWHPGMDLLWCGQGFRTDRTGTAHLADKMGLAVAPLTLIDPYFYHLDTCMSIIDGQTVAWVPEAFSERSIRVVDSFFKRKIEVPYEEAKETLACNCWCPDDKNVLVPLGAKTLKTSLETLGFEVHQVDTSEFQKAGGSIFCLKLAYF